MFLLSYDIGDSFPFLMEDPGYDLFQQESQTN